ncbi:MAG: hypothetical protein AAFR61_18325 [Bacteroidota bacterium]
MSHNFQARLRQLAQRLLKGNGDSWAALLKACGGEAVPEDVARILSLNTLQAERKLNGAYAKGILERRFDYDRHAYIYVMKNPEQYENIPPLDLKKE